MLHPNIVYFLTRAMMCSAHVPLLIHTATSHVGMSRFYATAIFALHCLHQNGEQSQDLVEFLTLFYCYSDFWAKIIEKCGKCFDFAVRFYNYESISFWQNFIWSFDWITQMCDIQTISQSLIKKSLLLLISFSAALCEL